jgi:hypothetical protein
MVPFLMTFDIVLIPRISVVFFVGFVPYEFLARLRC